MFERLGKVRFEKAALACQCSVLAFLAIACGDIAFNTETKVLALLCGEGDVLQQEVIIDDPDYTFNAGSQQQIDSICAQMRCDERLFSNTFEKMDTDFEMFNTTIDGRAVNSQMWTTTFPTPSRETDDNDIICYNRNLTESGSGEIRFPIKARAANQDTNSDFVLNAAFQFCIAAGRVI